MTPFEQHMRQYYPQSTTARLSLEVARLERRFLEETAAHDKTRHRLECRERELERIRSNMYSERVEESGIGKEEKKQ